MLPEKSPLPVGVMARFAVDRPPRSASEPTAKSPNSFLVAKEMMSSSFGEGATSIFMTLEVSSANARRLRPMRALNDMLKAHKCKALQVVICKGIHSPLGF